MPDKIALRLQGERYLARERVEKRYRPTAQDNAIVGFQRYDE